jgi:predicted membrane protein
MDRKLKHLEFIQGTINRLSTNSFLLKGWSVVLVAALFALSANDTEIKFVFLAYFPAVVFWGLDAYFLMMERVYRQHYNRVRTRKPDEIDFSMDTSDLVADSEEWMKAVFSKTLIVFHGVLLLSIIGVMIVQLRSQ